MVICCHPAQLDVGTRLHTTERLPHLNTEYVAASVLYLHSFRLLNRLISSACDGRMKREDKHVNTHAIHFSAFHSGTVCNTCTPRFSPWYHSTCKSLPPDTVPAAVVCALIGRTSLFVNGSLFFYPNGLASRIKKSCIHHHLRSPSSIGQIFCSCQTPTSCSTTFTGITPVIRRRKFEGLYYFDFWKFPLQSELLAALIYGIRDVVLCILKSISSTTC